MDYVGLQVIVTSASAALECDSCPHHTAPRLMNMHSVLIHFKSLNQGMKKIVCKSSDINPSPALLFCVAVGQEVETSAIDRIKFLYGGTARLNSYVP